MKTIAYFLIISSKGARLVVVAVRHASSPAGVAGNFGPAWVKNAMSAVGHAELGEVARLMFVVVSVPGGFVSAMLTTTGLPLLETALASVASARSVSRSFLALFLVPDSLKLMQMNRLWPAAVPSFDA